MPTPGKGALTVACEVKTKLPLPILDIAYCSHQLSFCRTQISQWLTHEQYELQEEIAYRKENEAVDEEYISSRLVNLEKESARQEKDALGMYGMLEGSDPSVAPLRCALAVWGLTADDIGVLSIHGTSTGANEKNETAIWNNIFATISRTPGDAVPIIAQKSVLGHTKGGSAAWQATGLLQSVITGVIPGNRNSE